MKNDELMFTSNISEPISIEEYATIKPIFESLDATVRLNNSCMFVIDFAKNEMVYMTDALLFIGEATNRDIQRESPNPYWSLILEDDLDIMLETWEAYLQFIPKLKPSQRLKHTFVMDYRI